MHSIEPTQTIGLSHLDQIGTTVIHMGGQVGRHGGRHRHRVTRGRHRTSEDAVRRDLRRAAVAGAGSVVGLRRDKPITRQPAFRNITTSVAAAWGEVGRALWAAMNLESHQR